MDDGKPVSSQNAQNSATPTKTGLSCWWSGLKLCATMDAMEQLLTRKMKTDKAVPRRRSAICFGAPPLAVVVVILMFGVMLFPRHVDHVKRHAAAWTGSQASQTILPEGYDRVARGLYAKEMVSKRACASACYNVLQPSCHVMIT